MILEQALNIFNLEYNCTEEDLKTSYRELVSKLNIISITKIKELNEAKNIILKHIDAVKQNKEYQQKISEYKILKNMIIDEIKYITSIDSEDKTFAEFKDKFIEININFYNYLNSNPNGCIAMKYYKNYRDKYLTLLCYYIYECWKKSHIINLLASDVDIDIHTSLYETRCKITKVIDDILDKELENYKNIQNYEEMKPLLIGTKLGYVNVCLWGYTDIKTAKIDFNKEINELIDKYYKRKQLIEELMLVRKVSESQIKALYDAILDEKEFFILYDQLTPSIKIRAKIKGILSKNYSQM